MKFEDLSPELQEKAAACKTAEEIFALAKSEGIELSDEQLEAVSGGALFSNFVCWLGCHDYIATGEVRQGLSSIENEYRCKNCGNVYWRRKEDKPWYA